MDRVLELINDINASYTMDIRTHRVHGLMKYLMKNMKTDWEITDLLMEKVTQWEAEGMSTRKVKEYRSFLKSMEAKKVCTLHV